MEEQINTIGVLPRREIEARIITPLLEAFSDEFGKKRVLEITQQVILKVAREQGAALAQLSGGCTLALFASALELWQKGDALTMDVLVENEKLFAFNVTRCRYAEMYREMGIPELGKILSCSRDYALVEGFNPEITLTRTATLLEGAPFCDFRYWMK